MDDLPYAFQKNLDPRFQPHSFSSTTIDFASNPVTSSRPMAWPAATLRTG